jgi:hypothetical protein
MSRPQGQSVAGRMESMTNPSDPISNHTHELPTCSAVPQPTAPPCTTLTYLSYILIASSHICPDVPSQNETIYMFIRCFNVSCMYCPSHPSLIYNPNNIWWGVQIMKFLQCPVTSSMPCPYSYVLLLGRYKNGIWNVKIFVPYKMGKASSSGIDHMHIVYKVDICIIWIPIRCYGTLLHEVILFLWTLSIA